MIRVNLREIIFRLSHDVRLVKPGEDIIRCERDKAFAEICPLPDIHTTPKKRKLALMKGSCSVGTEFFQADTEILRDFEAAQIFSEAKL